MDCSLPGSSLHGILQKNQNTKHILILQFRTLKSIVVPHNSCALRGWHGVNRPEEFLMEEGEEVGEGRAEGLSATGDGGHAAM